MFDHKKYYAETRKKREEQGLCIRCGVKLPTECKKLSCEACLAKRRKYVSDYSKGIRRDITCREPVYDPAEINICLDCKEIKCSGYCKKFPKSGGRKT